MNKIMFTFLVALAVLAAGCPHNNYEVTLTPRGNIIKRTLVFYRTDDSGSRGNDLRYEMFDPEELALITSFYPEAGVTHDENRHTVRGEFAHELPGDIGGSGWYTYLSTSLGDAGFYVERFRGNDDIVAIMEKKYQAADQLTDLTIGWSNAQFKSESGLQKLHRFLDQDFRHDLKNLSLYEWMGEDLQLGDLNGGNWIRFWQYLIERGYAVGNDAAGLIRGWPSNDEVYFLWLQRLIARKLGITDEQPVPQSLEFEAVEKSLIDYLAGTDAYQAKLRNWEKKKITNPRAQKPDPSDVVTDLCEILLISMESNGPNRLTVKLSLSSEPLRTNGKWDEANKRVLWESELAGKDDISRLPVFCYADWVVPRGDFQKDHFSSVLLTGEELLKYCFWRTSLEEKMGLEWDKFLANLAPDADAINKLKNFQFAGPPEQINANALYVDFDIGKELLKEALQPEQ